MGKNGTGKYLKYAIGEILLIVIGILVALFLNNLSTDRKERTLEVKTLRELHASFVGDLKDINFNLAFHEKGLFASQKLLRAFDENLPYHDSLDQSFGQFMNISVLIHGTGAFETLKSRGMDIISNDSLRRQVVSMHDIIYNEILENQNNFDYIDLQENTRFMFEHMKEWKMFESAKPRDFSKISKDPVFRNRLEYTAQVRSAMIYRYRRAKAECEDVIQSLKQEIERLE